MSGALPVIRELPVKSSVVPAGSAAADPALIAGESDRSARLLTGLAKNGSKPELLEPAYVVSPSMIEWVSVSVPGATARACLNSTVPSGSAIGAVAPQRIVLLTVAAPSSTRSAELTVVDEFA